MNLCNGKIEEEVKCSHCNAINIAKYSDYANIFCEIVKDHEEAIGICNGFVCVGDTD
jgi:predicted methyltransferase